MFLVRTVRVSSLVIKSNSSKIKKFRE